MMKKIVEGAKSELRKIIDEICVDKSEVEKTRIYNVLEKHYVNLIGNIVQHISNRHIHVEQKYGENQ